MKKMKEFDKPLVSIGCITYNHEKYIRDAIKGFLMQKTTFPFEILIHDDASTDGTADIIREYEKKYPDKIKPIYQMENQYSKGIPISATYQFPRARGKYIALCEGDDYWTDPYKLQKQVDFLEKNIDYGLTFGDFICVNDKNIQVEKSGFFKNKKIQSHIDGYCFADYIDQQFSILTVTVLYRSDLLKQTIDYWPEYVYDVWIFQRLLFVSKIYKFSEVFAAYRDSPGSITKSIKFHKTVQLADYDNTVYFIKHLKESPDYNQSKYVMFKKLLGLLLLSKISLTKKFLLIKYFHKVFPGWKKFLSIIKNSNRFKRAFNTMRKF